MPQPILIQSELTDDNGDTLVLDVSGSAQPGANIVLNKLDPASTTQQWQLTAEGYVENIANPSLVLGIASDNESVVLVSKQANAPGQYWNFTFNNYLANQGSSLWDGSEGSAYVLAVSGGEGTVGAAITVTSASNREPSQSWFPLPSLQPLPRSTRFVASQMQDGRSVLAVSSATATAGTPLGLLSGKDAGESALWQINSDGTITSALDPSLCMSASSSSGPVTVTSYQGQNNSFQLWSTSTSSNVITSQQYNNNVAIAGFIPFNTPGIVLSSTPGAGLDVWYQQPSYALDAILSQKDGSTGVSFPAWANQSQIDAYNAINQNLGAGKPFNLRDEYHILDAPIGAYKSTLDTMTPPDGVSSADWDAVVSQLNTEITDALAVRLLYGCYRGFHTALFADEGARLNQAISDAGLEQGTNVSGDALNMLLGIINAALNFVPVVGGALSSLVQTAVTMAQEDGQITPSPFQVAVSNLWSQLSSTFEALLSQINQQEQAILTDWNKLSAVAGLITATGPGSLSWDTGAKKDSIAIAAQAYMVSALQILLPAKYTIYRFLWQKDDQPLPGVPAYAQWIEEVDGTWNKYWIADSSSNSEFPTSILMENDLWNNGASQADFFKARNGWNGFTVVNASLLMWPANDNNMCDYCDWAEITIVNTSPSDLTITINVEEGVVPGNLTRSLPAYGSITFGAGYLAGLEVSVGIWDYSVSSTNTVAGFVAHQHQSAFVAGDFWFDGLSWAMGYKITSQLQFSGSIRTNRPGIGVITITQSN